MVVVDGGDVPRYQVDGRRILADAHHRGEHGAVACSQPSPFRMKKKRSGAAE